MKARAPVVHVLAMVLAGGEGKRLAPLTADRAKPAVPFGGSYRLIDFALSNLANADSTKGADGQPFEDRAGQEIFLLRCEDRSQERQVALVATVNSQFEFAVGLSIRAKSPRREKRSPWLPVVDKGTIHT